jgi:2-aminoadipate transaminase
MAEPFLTNGSCRSYAVAMDRSLLAAARQVVRTPSSRPRYVRLAEALADRMGGDGATDIPSARALAATLGLNRATVTAAYRELARRGLIVLQPGRRGTRPLGSPRLATGGVEEPPAGTVDLARYAPDRSLLPSDKVLRWLGLGEGEGEAVAQYGDAWGYGPLREWLAARLRSWGLDTVAEGVLLTSGVQHGLDLLLRALVRPGDTVMVEDPTYPGLPPLLGVHGVRVVGIPVHPDGLDPDEVALRARRTRPALAIVTPTLHNPSGVVADAARRRSLVAALAGSGVTVVEELFDPGLVIEGTVPPPMAALDRTVVAVGSFSKALFPGLRVGWLVGPHEVVERVAAVKRATDLSGSPFLEATAWGLCRRGQLEAQLARLRSASRSRRALALSAMRAAPSDVRWSEPRGGFSMLLALPPGSSARALAARAARRGVWVLPGPLMSVSGRDDVVRVSFAAAAGPRLRDGLTRLVTALAEEGEAAPLV